MVLLLLTVAVVMCTKLGLSYVASHKSSSTLQLLIIIHHIITANTIGLNVGSTCIPFENISSHPSISDELHQVGWIKVISCNETGGTHDNPFTMHRNDYTLLSLRAISIKFQPPGGINNPSYDDLTVIAKPYSNPIQYGLNRNKELSFTYNSAGNGSGVSNTSNWIGTSTALGRLVNDCRGKYPDAFHETIYHGCNNDRGIVIFPNRDDTVYVYVCLWDLSSLTMGDIEIYFGFVPEVCDAESQLREGMIKSTSTNIQAQPALI